MHDLRLLCFDGIYRVYRNTTVHHIRTTLKRRYPNDFRQRLADVLGQEWIRVREAAQLRRETGEMDTPLVDDFDCLSVNHFYNIFNRYFPLLFPDIMNQSERVKKETRAAILYRCKLVKSLRDPALGHPSEEAIHLRDAFEILNSARYVLQHIDSERAEEIDRMINDNIFASDPRSSPDDSTLPSREAIVSHFVGRQAELNQLNRWLRDPNQVDQYLWLLAGDGGKGKTAIAYEFATQIRDNPPPHLELEAVIWASAKSRRFVSGQPIVESPDFSGLESALDIILRACAAPDDILDLPISEKRRECLEHLTEFPSLVVLDDVDTLDERDETVSFFLQNIRSTKSRLLLTSRRIPALFGNAYTQVKGLSNEDGAEFIRTRVQIHHLPSPLFTKKISNRIVNACDGSPLFMEDLLRLCRVGEAPGQAIHLWKKYKGEAARRYALGREYDMLESSARNVLLACALFDGYVSLEDISIVTHLTEDVCRHAIEELQGLFLVPAPYVVRDVPRFILNGNTRRLVLEVYGDRDAARRMKGMVDTVSGKSQATRESRELLRRFVRRADKYARQQNYEAARNTLENGIKRFPSYADLYGKLGWLYKSWDPPTRDTDARNAFKQAAQLKSDNEDTYWHWWALESRDKEWTSAAEAAEQGLKTIQDSIALMYAAGYAHSRKAKDLQYTDLTLAEQEAKHAERHLKNARNRF